MAERLRKTAMIIGGSIAGLFVARLLARQGWDVRIFEKVGEDLRSRGAGVATHPETFAALGYAGLAVGDDLGISVSRRRVLDRSGTITHDVERPQIMASWARIYATLRDGLDGVRLDAGRALTRIRFERSQVVAVLADGAEVAGDVLIGADGFRSTVRQQILPDVAPQYSGYFAWRGLVPEERLSPVTRERVFEEFCFCMPPREQMAGYPVRSAENGSDSTPARAYNFIWYRPLPAEALGAYLTDSRGGRHDLSVPPPLVRPELITDVRNAARALLSPEFVDIVEQTADPFYQPIYDLEVPSMRQGPVALIGDAAFVARPHVGAGVTKAFEDGVALANCLGDGSAVDEGLERFTRLRTPISRRVVARGRELGAVMMAPGGDEHRRAEEMMLGSATLDFLG